jgi:hypothetical protein
VGARLPRRESLQKPGWRLPPSREPPAIVSPLPPEKVRLDRAAGTPTEGRKCDALAKKTRRECGGTATKTTARFGRLIAYSAGCRVIDFEQAVVYFGDQRTGPMPTTFEWGSSRPASLPHIWATSSQYVWSSEFVAKAALARHRSTMVRKYAEELRTESRRTAISIISPPPGRTRPTSGIGQSKRIACDFAISRGSLGVVRRPYLAGHAGATSWAGSRAGKLAAGGGADVLQRRRDGPRVEASVAVKTAGGGLMGVRRVAERSFSARRGCSCGVRA